MYKIYVLYRQSRDVFSRKMSWILINFKLWQIQVIVKKAFERYNKSTAIEKDILKKSFSVHLQDFKSSKKSFSFKGETNVATRNINILKLFQNFVTAGDFWNDHRTYTDTVFSMTIIDVASQKKTKLFCKT